MDLKNVRMADIVFAVFNIIFLFGSIFVFHTCAQVDGKWMTCHYAGNIVTLLSAVCAVLSVTNLFVKLETKIGFFISEFLIYAALIFVPGNLIPLCMMSEMQCNATSKPCTLIFAVTGILCSALNTAAVLLKIRNQKKAKNEISK